MRCIYSILIIMGYLLNGYAQSSAWTLWASGLPSGVYPRMAVAPNHDIFYALLGAGTNLGYVYRASTLDDSGQFEAMPQIPRPVSIQNNIVALGYNKLSEPLVGIYRTDLSEPWLFRYDQQAMHWDTAIADATPTLGGHCIATAPDGTIYVGARWAYIYKSSDDGATFHAIDESTSIAASYPCYYPSWNGSESDGAIFSINVDRHGRVYAGTETAGVIYSDDQGAHWKPADAFACLPEDPEQYDTMSPMLALALGGNIGAVGFTTEDNLVWSGPDMWKLGWKNKMGYSDLVNGTVTELQGLPDYLVQTGQQVSRIVTTVNGRMFFHSGSSNGAEAIGIYTSTDGIHWTIFNDGITGQNDGLSQGSLTVDGNRVFMATHDGKVWMYDDGMTSTADLVSGREDNSFVVYPNPASSSIAFVDRGGHTISGREVYVYNAMGEVVLQPGKDGAYVSQIMIEDLAAGYYFVCLRGDDKLLRFSGFCKI